MSNERLLKLEKQAIGYIESRIQKEITVFCIECVHKGYVLAIGLKRGNKIDSKRGIVLLAQLTHSSECPVKNGSDIEHVKGCLGIDENEYDRSLSVLDDAVEALLRLNDACQANQK